MMRLKKVSNISAGLGYKGSNYLEKNNIKSEVQMNEDSVLVVRDNIQFLS